MPNLMKFDPYCIKNDYSPRQMGRVLVINNRAGPGVNRKGFENSEHVNGAKHYCQAQSAKGESTV